MDRALWIMETGVTGDAKYNLGSLTWAPEKKSLTFSKKPLTFSRNSLRFWKKSALRVGGLPLGGDRGSAATGES